MKAHKNLVAFVTGTVPNGPAFARAKIDGKLTDIFVPTSTVNRVQEELTVGDRVVVDVMTQKYLHKKSGETRDQLAAIAIHEVAEPDQFVGEVRVKFYNPQKGAGYVTMQFNEGPVDAFLPKSVVDQAGWFPAAGLILDVKAVDGVKGWSVESFMLVEKTGEATTDAVGDGFIDLVDEADGDEATKIA